MIVLIAWPGSLVIVACLVIRRILVLVDEGSPSSSATSHRCTSPSLLPIILLLLFVPVVVLLNRICTHSSILGNALSSFISLLVVKILYAAIGSVATSTSRGFLLKLFSIILFVNSFSLGCLRPFIQMEIIPRTNCARSSPLPPALTPYSFPDRRYIFSSTCLNVVIVAWSTSAWLRLLSWQTVPVFVLARWAATHPSATTTMLSARLLWVSNTLLDIYFIFELLLRFCLHLNLHVIVIELKGTCSSTALSTSTSSKLLIAWFL